MNENRDSITDKSINDYIDKLHFRTPNHLMNKLKTKFADVSNEHLLKLIDEKWHDKFVKLRKITPYYIKIFSTKPNCWFHDLMDNGVNADPRYWHIFIGTNNHYAVAYPLANKSTVAVKSTLTQFINKYHPVKLTSDQESSFISNMKLLSENRCQMHVITDQNHSALGIIDRFIRTLRDMNIPTAKGIRQSHDIKYKSISINRMNKLLDIYNSTYHSRIKCSPQQMFDNPDLERDYIFDQLDKRDKQQNIKDLHLTEGSFVRYIIPRANGRKKRYQYSHECYKIANVNGNMYTLIARDGTVMRLPRFKLSLCCDNGTKPKNMKWADTIPGKWNGLIKNIISFDSKSRKYRVAFVVPDKPDYIDEIPESYMRGNYPQLVNKFENDMIKQNND